MPRKAKKGGGGSQTEEERLLLQQRRAQTEEEASRQREEMLTLFLKDKLQKDQRKAEVNLLKINDHWRTILRHARGAELRADVTVLSQTFEGHVDILDDIIQTLVRELSGAERQSAQVRQAHLRNMDELRRRQENRLVLLQQLWDSNMQQLLCGFSHDRKVRMEERLQHQQQLQDAAFGVQTQHEAAVDETAALYNKVMASYTAAQHHRVCDGAPSSKEQLQRQEDKKLCSGEQKRLLEAIAANQRLLQAADEETKEAKRLQDKLLRLKQKVGSEQLTEASLQQALAAKTQQVKQKTQVLRLQLSQTQKRSQTRLRHVSVRSNQAARRLQAAVAKGQKVLRVAELCRQLEVKSGVSWVSLEADAPQTEPSQFLELQRLLRRRNGALLQREALRKQKDDLRVENQQLRRLLRQHLDAVEGTAIGAPPTASPAAAAAATHRATAAGHAHLLTASPPRY